MQPLLYGELTPWYRLIDPPAEHADEAHSYLDGFARAGLAGGSLLELGSGAGHNALHFAPRFRCTLTDLSEDMLALSRELNPACEHLAADMRTLRLGREFDAVFVHDAVMYMTSEADLAAAIATAFAHTRPGGAAIFAPDCFRDTFHESSELLESDDGARAVRFIEWKWDPDPADHTYQVDYAFLLRDGQTIKAVHDRHIEGMFARETWLRLLEAAGYAVELIPRALDDHSFDQILLCRRP